MQVSVTINTVEQKFPAGTVGGNWNIEVSPADDPGSIINEYVGPNPNTTFDLTEGEAVLFRASRLDAADNIIGPLVTAQYTVGEELVPVDVAATLSISASPVGKVAGKPPTGRK